MSTEHSRQSHILQLPDTKSDTEPWFDLPYVATSVPKALLADWEAAVPSPELALPPRNSYLPSDFSLRGAHADEANQVPPGSPARNTAA